VIKHSIDKRHPTAVVARTGLSLPATLAASTLATVPCEPNTLYAVDEVQFFGPGLIPFALAVLQQEQSALVMAGLDLDYARKPFGAALQLAQIALDPNSQLSGTELCVHRLAARCAFNTSGPLSGIGRMVRSDSGKHDTCGRPALFSQRLHEGGTGTVLIGGAEFYQPACELHHSRAPVSRRDWGVG
jgi:thymidine kinase